MKINVNFMDVEIIQAIPGSPETELQSLFKQTDKEAILCLTKEIEELYEENSRLRTALSKVASNLGNGSVACAEASLEFLEEIPREVKLVCDRLRREALEYRHNIHPICKI